MSRGRVEPEPQKRRPVFGLDIPCSKCKGKGGSGKKNWVECQACDGAGFVRRKET